MKRNLLLEIVSILIFLMSAFGSYSQSKRERIAVLEKHVDSLETLIAEERSSTKRQKNGLITKIDSISLKLSGLKVLMGNKNNTIDSLEQINLLLEQRMMTVKDTLETIRLKCEFDKWKVKNHDYYLGRLIKEGFLKYYDDVGNGYFLDRAQIIEGDHMNDGALDIFIDIEAHSGGNYSWSQKYFLPDAQAYPENSFVELKGIINPPWNDGRVELTVEGIENGVFYGELRVLVKGGETRYDDEWKSHDARFIIEGNQIKLLE